MSTSYVSQSKLRLLAPRADQVIGRHKDKSAFLASFEPRLKTAIATFINLYDLSRTAKASATEKGQAQKALGELRIAVRGWLAQVARDIPGFDISSYTDSQESDEALVSAAYRLLEVGKNFQGPNGEPLEYRDAMLGSLGPAVDKAAADTADAQAEAVAAQELQQRTREAAVALHKELIALRRSLRAVIGTSHLDYRRLRVSPGSTASDEVEEVEEVVPQTVQPLATTSPSIASVVPPSTNGARHNGVYPAVSFG